MSAIKRSSSNGYRFGRLNKPGLQALIHKLSGMLRIAGMHAEVITSLFLYLADKVEDLFQVHGETIDCGDMTASLEQLKRQQGVLGVRTVSHRIHQRNDTRYLRRRDTKAKRRAQ